jgi:hypothetical protein
MFIEKPSIYGTGKECLFFCKVTTLKKLLGGKFKYGEQNYTHVIKT